MKYCFAFIVSTILFASCVSKKSCKDLNGKFSEFSTNSNSTNLTTYEFDGNSVKLMSMSKYGKQEYKSDGTQNGKFNVDGDKVVMNFGGSDVTLIINRNSDGCVISLSNDIATYEKR